MADIFLSYASADREKARQIAHCLQQVGWSVWWDRALLGGQVFSQVIARELAAAGCVVVLWSPHARSSDWVPDEAAEGRRRNVLVPCSLDSEPPPLGFRQRHTIALSGWDGDGEASAFGQVKAAVEALIGPAGFLRSAAASDETEVDWPAPRSGVRAAAPYIAVILGLALAASLAVSALKGRGTGAATSDEVTVGDGQATETLADDATTTGAGGASMVEATPTPPERVIVDRAGRDTAIQPRGVVVGAGRSTASAPRTETTSSGAPTAKEETPSALPDFDALLEAGNDDLSSSVFGSLEGSPPGALAHGTGGLGFGPCVCDDVTQSTGT